MATNYVYIDFATTTPASGLIRVENSNKSDWSAYGQTVQVGLAKPTGAYTHYKLWGYSGHLTDTSVSWTTIPASGTISVNLDNTEDGVQYLYAKWSTTGDDGGEGATLMASGISYSWTEPTKHAELSWVDLNDNNDLSNTLRDSVNDIDFTMTDANFKHLQFNSRDFTGIQMEGGKITVTSGSEFWKLIEYDTDAYVEIKKTFPTDALPFVTMLVDGTPVPVTKYDGTVKDDYADRVDGYSWNSVDKELDFNIYKFSTYGTAILDNIAFTLDSEISGYDGNSIQLKARVTDTDNNGVDSAPVTFSGIAGDNIGNFSANPVNTDANGYATATLNLTSVGQATYEAKVDSLSTDTDQITTCMTFPTNLQRSLLTQLEQIRFSATYDDNVTWSGIRKDTAEPSDSTFDAGFDDVLEHDMNVIRTMIKEMSGGDATNWFDAMGTYPNPTNSGEPYTANLATMKGNTLDAKTIIVAVGATNSGLGFDISTSASGFLFDTVVGYASTVTGDSRGLPIFASTTNLGDWWDDDGTDEVCVIDLINSSTGTEFTVSGTSDIIYAKFHDGEDFGGTGDNYDVYVRFYSNNAPYTWAAGDPANISMIFPYRKVMSEMEEHEWMRTDFVSRFEGDAEMVDDMVNLWSYTGGGDDVTGPSWTSSGDYWMIDASDNLFQATESINDGVGDRDYDGYSYLTTDETIVSSLQALATQVEENYNNTTAVQGAKYIVALPSNISAGTAVTLPDSQNYTPTWSGIQEGKNLDIFFNGQLLAASTGVSGVNADRDYAELTSTTVKFHEDLYQDDNITYVIRT